MRLPYALISTILVGIGTLEAGPYSQAFARAESEAFRKLAAQLRTAPVIKQAVAEARRDEETAHLAPSQPSLDIQLTVLADQLVGGLPANRPRRIAVTQFTPVDGPIESTEMKRLALRLGVPEAAMITEDRARNTYENAVETKRLLGEAWILLVTSASHVPRALALFRKQGLTVTPFPCGYLVRDRPWQGWDGNPFDLIPEAEALGETTIALTEIVGTIIYRATGKI